MKAILDRITDGKKYVLRQANRKTKYRYYTGKKGATAKIHEAKFLRLKDIGTVMKWSYTGRYYDAVEITEEEILLLTLQGY